MQMIWSFCLRNMAPLILWLLLNADLIIKQGEVLPQKLTLTLPILSYCEWRDCSGPWHCCSPGFVSHLLPNTLTPCAHAAPLALGRQSAWLSHGFAYWHSGKTDRFFPPLTQTIWTNWGCASYSELTVYLNAAPGKDCEECVKNHFFLTPRYIVTLYEIMSLLKQQVFQAQLLHTKSSQLHI